MSNLTDLISAGGGGGATVAFNVHITTSQTWTPPYNGVGTIHLIGAGGGGGSDKAGNRRSGGAAGGYCKKEVTFSTSTNWTMVVGAKGNGTSDQSGSGANGSAGGNTTATDGTISLAANGGGGGINGTPAVGTASGGDVNFSGGSSNLGQSGGAVGTTANGQNGVGGFNANYGIYTADSDFISPYDPLAYGYLTGGDKGGRNSWTAGGATGNYKDGENGGFGGGGGHGNSGYNYVLPSAGHGGIGGGGGASVNVQGTTADYYKFQSGTGGVGLILIQYKTIT